MSHQKDIGLNEAKLEKYILEHSSKENDNLYELFRKTHVRLYHPRRSTDHLSGLFLQMISHMIQPRRILEIGTFSGYGTVCLASGLAENGIIHTIEINDELEDFIREVFGENGLTDRVRLHIGDARDIIPRLKQTFDLVFIDAEKDEYLAYYHLVFNQVRAGGFIVADNVLWSGKVLDEQPPNKDHFTRGIRAFNHYIRQDARVENIILPMFDGMSVIRKKE